MTAGQYIISKLVSLDWLILSVIFILIFLGILAIQSATVETTTESIQNNLQRQITWSII